MGSCTREWCAISSDWGCETARCPIGWTIDAVTAASGTSASPRCHCAPLGKGCFDIATAPLRAESHAPPARTHLILGTRPSRLALRQSQLVAAALMAAWPTPRSRSRVYTTQGDRDVHRPLPRSAARGLFTAEIEAALRAGEIDLAVHSLKDLPIEDGRGLVIGAVPQRAAPHDVLVSRHGLPLASLQAAPPHRNQ